MDKLLVDPSLVSKADKTNHSKKVLNEFELMAAEIKLKITEVENIKSYIQTDDKRNHTSNEDILQQLDDLRTALDAKEILLRSAHEQNVLLESDSDYVHEKILKLKAELKEKDVEIKKLRNKIKKFDKFREDMLAETKKTKDELTAKMDKVTGDFEFVREEFQFMHSAMKELLTGAKKDNIKKKPSGWNSSLSTQNAQNARQKKSP